MEGVEDMKHFRNLVIAFVIGFVVGLNLGLIKKSLKDFRNCSFNSSGNIYALDCEVLGGRSR